MKYVVIRAKMGNLTREIPIIFPNDLTHKDVARAVVKMIPEAKDGVPVSAGEVNSFALGAKPFGKSVTLGLSARPEDEQLIAMCDYGGHIQ